VYTIFLFLAKYKAILIEEEKQKIGLKKIIKALAQTNITTKEIKD